MLKCILCKSFSPAIICRTCQSIYLQPQLHTRILSDGFKVYSFYRYQEISPLLTTKHTMIGHQIYQILSRHTFKKFAQHFDDEYSLFAIPIDDQSQGGYSHTAILAHALKSKQIKPLYRAIRAKNSVSYSGKSLAYRMEHPRDFEVKIKGNNHLILVDDIVTTGLTMMEARKAVENSGQSPIFGLCLADAKEF